ncbi:hypothetical protein AVEN_149315-1 [Araneus ventricosus]|uniref:Uncharacterized protein n=1 Tax=Araneus ventricosus TaxID=182803 RepID=A0A4Y2WY63_ARAVE|nr:hypothetical protein AVEN_149315-1 [Araneus ventricosus]
MSDLIADTSPTTEKTKSEASISNSVEISSAQDGQSCSAPRYRLTGKKQSAARSAAAASKPVKKSNTSVAKRTTGKGYF